MLRKVNGAFFSPRSVRHISAALTIPVVGSLVNRGTLPVRWSDERALEGFIRFMSSVPTGQLTSRTTSRRSRIESCRLLSTVHNHGMSSLHPHLLKPWAFLGTVHNNIESKEGRSVCKTFSLILGSYGRVIFLSFVCYYPRLPQEMWKSTINIVFVWFSLHLINLPLLLNISSFSALVGLAYLIRLLVFTFFFVE